MLDRDLSDLLVEFSLALGHQAAYPEGHPVLAAASQRLTHAVVGVLAGRPSLTLGIARRQFVIDGVLTVHMNGEEHALQAGDAMYFDSTVPHAYRRSGGRKCSALVVTAS